MNYQRPSTIDHRLFGTDGIRGTPGEYPLTDVIIFKIGKACANLLHYQRGITNRHLRIIIGKDTRSSCERIEKILANGVSSCDVEVILSGTLPTPDLAFLTRKFKADMGIMISASHNQAKDNGIKFFSNSGYKLALKQEEFIEKLVLSELIELDALSFDSLGSVSQIEDGKGIYIDFLKPKAADLDIARLKIIIDCAYGALSNIAPVVFKELGVQLHSMNDQPNGVNINLDCGALHPKNMAKVVVKTGADKK